MDVFFVISGYLITSIIYKDYINGQFSLVGFWERRVRRIIPPLAVVLLVTAIGSFLILFPRELKNFSQSLIAQTFFASNFLFWSEAGYFDAPSKIKPLLHTWSLSIEEQFYIIYPILLTFCLSRSKRFSFLAIACLLILSFLTSIFLLKVDPHTAFFLLPARAWELLIGCLVFFLPVVSSGKYIFSTISAVAALVLILSFLVIDSSMPFPGVVALVPCLSAALIIYCNSVNKNGIVYQLLSTRPLVKLGLLSYSLYLWHWPIFVLAAFHSSKPLEPFTHAILIAISVLMAYLSWKFIETPVRARQLLPTRTSVFGAATASFAVMIILGLTGNLLKGIPQRFPADVMTAYSGHQYSNPRRRECLFSERKRFREDDICFLGIPQPELENSTIEFALVGDSHASSIMPIIDDLATKNRSTGLALAYNGCPPLRGVSRNDAGIIHQCDEFVESALQVINARKIPVLILAARWNLYLEQGILSHRLLPKSCTNELVQGTSCEDTTIKLRNSLEQFLKKLESPSRIILLAQVPQQQKLMSPRYLASRILRQQNPDTTATTLSQHIENNTASNEILDSILENSNFSSRHKIQVIDVTNYLCDESKCGIEYQGGSLYRDDDHISTFAGRLVFPAFDVLFETE